MSWNIQTPGDYINGPLTVAGVAQFNSNVGVGVAPSAWNSNYNAIDIGANGSVSGRLGASNTVDITSNAFRNSAGDWVYKIATSSPAARYQVDGSSGSHIWYSGAAGTAGNTITGFSTALMTLSSTGLGIGGNPSARIHAIDSGGVCGAFSRAALPAAGLAALYIQAPVSSGFSNTPLLTFWYQNTGISNPNNECLAIRTNSTNRIFVNGTGAVALSGGNVAADGVGIVFPSTQSASTDANTLDDYEEGTFTPAITGSTTAGTATYVGRSGRYTKVGNQVHVQIFIDWNGHTGTGDTRITGLPFTNGANFSGAVVGYANVITVSANYFITAYVDAAQPWILLNQIPTGGGTNTTVPIDAAGTLVVSATYSI